MNKTGKAGPLYTKQEDDLLCLNRHLGITECARLLKRPYTSVSKRIYKLGLPNLTKEQRSTVCVKAFERQRPNDSRKINPEQFYKIETPEVAYFLGYIWADGYCKRQKSGAHILSMLIVDEDYLQVKGTFDKIGEWGITKFWPKPRGKYAAHIYAGNKPLVSYLISKDYHIKSAASPDKILETIPDNLKHYFWRGYFDGDGSFRIRKGVYQAYFCGSFAQDWDAHCRLLDRLGIKYKINKKPVKKAGSSVICVSSLEGVYRLGEYLYQGRDIDNIGLPRKYNQWLPCKEITETKRKCAALEIEEYPKTPVTRDLVYDLIKKYQPYITCRKIADHFGVKRWEISEHTQFLEEKGRIKFIGKTSDIRYEIPVPDSGHHKGPVQ